MQVLLAVATQDFGFPSVGWTVPLLQQALEIATEQRLSQDTLRRALHQRDYQWKRPRYDLEPDPEREKKTPHPPANRGAAPSQRGAGRGRDRPAALPAAARRLVEARRGGPGLAERPQRPAGHLRGHEPAHGGAGA